MSASLLVVDCRSFTSLPPHEALRLMTTPAHVERVDSPEAALPIIRQSVSLDILVSNTAHMKLFQQFREFHPRGKIILTTDLPMKVYSHSLGGQEHSLVDHIVANKARDGWVIHQLRVCIHKILNRDIFGISKYLASNTLIQRAPVRSSADREELNSKVMQFAEACHLGQHACRMAFGITEEMLMNTIYDAPAAAGIARFQHIDQTKQIDLLPEEYGELTFACDGQIFAIGTTDPFGALRKETFLTYLKKVLKRDEFVGLIDEKRGGAGLGLFKILYSSHAIICNVDRGKRTEIIALLNLNDQLRDFSTTVRSIHYFQA